MITLNPDGTATFHLIGKDEKVRQPRAREFQQLMDSWHDLFDALEMDKAEVRDLIADAEKVAATDDEAERLTQVEITQRQAKLNDRTRDLNRRREAMNVSWLNEVFSVLLGWGTIDPELLPASVFDPTWPSRLQNHWSLFPTAPGAP